MENNQPRREDAFDEAYFQDGSLRGTQYRDYAGTALLSRTYYEMAKVIFKIFQPSRVLEIGCALGPVIFHLNNMGVEAHGIDVSEWAIAHRLDERVHLGSAADLQFPDDSFDLVFSCHALEHLPVDLKDAAFSEMSRVCSSGIQFHMHPILGTPPYVGDEFGHLVNLRQDKTHSLLKDRPWWLEQWHRHGWQDAEVNVALIHDNYHFEFSDCQYTLSKMALPSEIYCRIAQCNLDAARAFHSTLAGRPAPGLDHYLSKIRG